MSLRYSRQPVPSSHMQALLSTSPSESDSIANARAWEDWDALKLVCLCHRLRKKAGQQCVISPPSLQFSSPPTSSLALHHQQVLLSLRYRFSLAHACPLVPASRVLGAFDPGAIFRVNLKLSAAELSALLPVGSVGRKPASYSHSLPLSPARGVLW